MCCAKAIDSDTLVGVFHTSFFARHNTVLCWGAREPLYTPADEVQPAKVFFREDYVSSALHEVAHWCIAGAARRRQRDYGYWYEPDGRDAVAQQRFLQVEAPPQALEWYFSQACGQPFRLSLDNLDGSFDSTQLLEFAEAVQNAARVLRERGLPPRGRIFFEALRAHSGGCESLSTLDCRADLLR